MIYRLSVYTTETGHEGYLYYGNKRDAERRRAELVREGYAREGLELTEHPTPKTKKEILAFLRYYASHPDNG